MTPSPSERRDETPKTPTRVGKNPQSSLTPKLTPKEIKNPNSTPRKPPKLGPPKSASKKADNAEAEDSFKVEEAKDRGESSGGEFSSELYQKIAMKDNDERTERSVAENDGESTSVADTSELDEAGPEPMKDDDDEETVAGARESTQDATETPQDAAEDQGTESEDAAEEADNESNKGTLGGIKSTAGGITGGIRNIGGKATGGVHDTVTDTTDKASKGDVAGVAKGAASNVQSTGEKVAAGAKDTAEDTASGVERTAEGARDDIPKDTQDFQELPDKAKDGVKDVKDTAQDTATGAQKTIQKSADDVKDTAEDTQKSIGQAAQSAQDTTQKATEESKNAVDETGSQAEHKAGDLDEVATSKVSDDKVDSGTEDVTEDVQDKAADDNADLASLKGLKVEENGDIRDDSGNVIGKLEEGDPADLEGYEVGDNGEILDEDGDVVGRVSLYSSKGKDLPGAAKDLADKAEGQVEQTVDSGQEEVEDAAETYLPELNVLKGLEVQENGDILDREGKILGRITEGDPADLVGMTLNEDGEILDEDGDVVGRAETLPQEVQQEAEDAQDQLSEVKLLDGLKVDEEGAVKDSKGNILGKIIEGQPEDLAGRTVNAEGEVLDEDGDVIGRAEVVPEAAKALQEQDQQQSPEAERIKDLEEQLKPNLDIVEGRKLNKKGNILDEEGEVLAKLVEGDPKDCAGKLPNENGEVIDDDGNVIGRVEVVSGEAAEEAMKEAHPELVDELEQAQKAAEEANSAKDGAEEAEETAQDAAGKAKEAEQEAQPNLSQLEGLKVNKKGEVVNEDGEPIARLTDGNIDDIRGKKINDKGEILDNDGNVLGKVEFISEAIEKGLIEMADQADQAEELPTSLLEGYKVNKDGEVLNENGDVIARLADGELEEVAGRKLNEKGEVLDKENNVIGKVELVQNEGESAPEQGDDNDGLPPLSILQGLKVNKSGKIVDNDSNAVGELTEGDPKKLWKLGITSDEEGQFWDNRGHVIGRAKTISREEEAEGEFSGLDGLVVVKDGWVEDENGNRVGRLTEGDAKKLVGRVVDEDGDIIDKRGNVVGHAERYEEPEEEQKAPDDLSELKGLSPNKQGNVVGLDGVPIGRLVEGSPKELSGRKIDENGQIWNDAGKVVGRCELIPPQEREAKPEGPFAGLSGLVVVQNGFVEDEDGNVVGQITEGDAKKLVGRSVDEDGDIIDKYGNVKGHAETYEAPEEEPEAPEDLSSLSGKTVNKQGKVVDEHGTIYGEVVEGSVKRLVGCKVDGEGQIWSNDGKVIGKAGVISGGDDGRAEGPFSNFESTTVSKDGLVKDNNGEIVGRVIEGDPKKLVGRHVDDDGDIGDKNGNVIGKAERWEPEQKEREVNPMAGMRVNKEGEVRDKNGDIIGRLTDGNLLHCIGREINDNGYVVDQDGNKLGEVTLLENIQEEPEEVEEGQTDEERKAEEERDIAKKIGNIINQTIERMEPICKQIDEAVDKADRTPREELDEQALVDQVKPLIEEGGRILNECNGSIRGLDPDGHIAAQAKARHASGEASPEENRVAEGLKDLTGNIVKCIDTAKKKIADMPHAKKKLSPLWALLTEPLFQIIAAVGLLLSGVLGLVGKLLNGLGLGGLVNGILGGLGINKLIGGLGLGSITESLGLGGGKKSK